MNAARQCVLAGLSLALGALTGCVPTIAHGPRVEPGATTGASVSLPYISDDHGYLYQPFAFGPFGVNGAYAWRDSDDGAGVRIGAAVNVFPPHVDPDFYLELPRTLTAGMDAGIGLAGGTILTPAALPYAQFGRIIDGSGPYVTAGYLHEIGRDSMPSSTQAYRDDGWLGTIAYQHTDGAHSRHYFLTGVLGHRVAHDCSLPSAGERPVCTVSRPWGLFAGITFEVARHRPLAR